MTDVISPKCPQCGSPLAASAPEGLCPRCLLEMNLRAATILTADEKTAARAEPPSLEKIAPLFPQLEILEYLGRGGMGVVYKARQRSLERLVALKILAPEREKEPEFATRFVREAQALARLNHPHIVTVHDFGEVKSEGGTTLFYLLMEFVDGVNLRQLLRTRRLQAKEALAIVPPVCEALQYAHERGIVHRDIKPENLLLDKGGRVKIADFGIAKMLGADVSDREEKSAGTPEYMAPEQRAAPESADHRADIYSLGVVLYEMLTGELPSSTLEPPSSRLHGMHLDVRLDEIVLRALHAQPELRYHTALDLKTQLELVAGESAKAVSSEEPKGSRGGFRSRFQSRMARIGALVLFFLGASFAAGLLLPGQYLAKVLIEVPPDNDPHSRPWLADRLYTQFLNQQLRVLRSPEVLDPVVERLHLQTALSQRRLARSLELREIPNTGLIEIGVYHRSAGTAAEIANMIAMVYREKRLTELQAAIERTLRELTKQVEAQRNLVQKAKLEVDQIRVAEQVIDPDPESFNSKPTMTDEAVAELRKEDEELVFNKLQSYLDAKSRYLMARKVFEAAQIKFSKETDEGIDFDPVKIWEKAEPPRYAVRVGLRRLWDSL